MIAVVVLTYNRVHLLRQCVENVLLRTSDATTELLVWNNASTDGTREYLDSVSDPRLRVIHHHENIGVNGYAHAVPLTSAPYFVELDDDVVEAPHGWDARLLDAFRRLPTMGYLQARLADDGLSPGADLFYRLKCDQYRFEERNGVRLWMDGPVGGGCTLSTRELHDRIGGYKTSRRHKFWPEDAEYIYAIQRLGYEAAILDDVAVVHHGGPHYSDIHAEKAEWYEHWGRVVARKTAVKRILLAIPLVRPLNARFGWFQPPPPRSPSRA